MTAQTGDRATKRRGDTLRGLPVKASATIFSGAMVCVDSTGNAVRAITATGLRSVGVAEHRAIGGATDGAERISVAIGVFCLLNSAGADQLTRADINGVAYIVDDQTVAKTNGTNTRSSAGVVFDVDEHGVWVELGEAGLPA